MKAFFLVIFMSLFTIGCSTSGDGYMQQNELLSQIETQSAPVIIDVRSSGEYQAGHVPNAIHIPFWQAFGTDKLDKYKENETLVLYCEHGPRAGIAKFAFYLAGFENINYLNGHMTNWRKAGLPIEK